MLEEVEEWVMGGREEGFLGFEREREMTLFNSWILFGFISLHDILSSLFVQLAFLFFSSFFFRKPFDL